MLFFGTGEEKQAKLFSLTQELLTRNIQDEAAGRIASLVPLGGKYFLVDYVHHLASVHIAPSDI